MYQFTNIYGIKGPMKYFPHLIFADLLLIICNKHVFTITNSISTSKGELIQP